MKTSSVAEVGNEEKFEVLMFSKSKKISNLKKCQCFASNCKTVYQIREIAFITKKLNDTEACSFCAKRRLVYMNIRMMALMKAIRWSLVLLIVG